MPTYKGAYSPDYKEGDLGNDTDSYLSRKPGVFVSSSVAINLSAKIDPRYWWGFSGPVSDKKV